MSELSADMTAEYIPAPGDIICSSVWPSCMTVMELETGVSRNKDGRPTTTGPTLVRTEQFIRPGDDSSTIDPSWTSLVTASWSLASFVSPHKVNANAPSSGRVFICSQAQLGILPGTAVVNSSGEAWLLSKVDLDGYHYNIWKPNPPSKRQKANAFVTLFGLMTVLLTTIWHVSNTDTFHPALGAVLVAMCVLEVLLVGLVYIPGLFLTSGFLRHDQIGEMLASGELSIET